MNSGNVSNDFNRWLSEKLDREAKKSEIQLSADFGQRFWEKVDARKNRSWLGRVSEQWHWEIVFPNLTQAVAVVLIAVSVGAAGGAYSTVNRANASLQTLSGFQEHRGVPSSSVAGAYFRIVSRGEN